MIRKLRIRFIIVTMAAVLLVLLVLIGGINLSNYRQVVSDGDAVLDLLMENGGTFFNQREFPRWIERETIVQWNFKDDSMEPNRSISYTKEYAIPDNADDFLRGGRRRISSPELPYETRYFSVLLSSEGDALRTDIGRISAVTQEDAIDYALRAANRSATSGFIGDYRYLVGKTDVLGNRLIVFTDCGASLAYFRGFRNISMAVSFLCLLLVGILVFFASGRVIRPVAESYEKQKRFITDAGHEIKTPLAIISADAEVLEMELTDESEWLSDIKTQTKRLSELTNDLIFLSKMEENRTVLEMKDLDLSALTEKQTSSFRAVASDTKALAPDIASGIHITADRKSIESLLTIVLDNAVKYCPDGGKIDVKLTRSKRHAYLEITNDTEEVISEESVKHLFDRFYRTDTSRNSQTGGYGIGLSMAAAIVEKHKGKITAESGKMREKSLTISISLRLGFSETPTTS
ncbi:MAG: HAMP domain-containing histidine kinase [Clostridiales bacterium]|nr:HAMP domain-containing histidine kinase [Clostridiales bacterium]